MPLLWGGKSQVVDLAQFGILAFSFQMNLQDLGYNLMNKSHHHKYRHRTIFHLDLIYLGLVQ